MPTNKNSHSGVEKNNVDQYVKSNQIRLDTQSPVSAINNYWDF